ncbi:helix-turn-helix transcriptional regulator [Nocardia sp. NBC_01327]|uniref:helix-turn-helix transcriptional regulator n=1 Tax=Nocardia sp. NBC_01327 TaxID=2903593 RepID=UPI002E10CD4E|nr:helix-turn-helix transcriptional regulator [Nocardia sp. NBC_01327]
MPQDYRERPSGIPGAVVWTRDITAGSSAPVLPDGCMDLLWINGRVMVAGPDTRAYHPSPGAGPQVSGIRFFPGTAPALLAIPAHELRDARVDLAAVWSPAVHRHAVDLLTAACTPTAGLEAIARWRAIDLDPVAPAMTRIVTELRAGTRVADLADTLGLGTRRLHRMSLDAFGYGPKTLARILRMQQALALARSGTPLAATAAQTGYSDQSHLSREIKELAGVPLTHLLQR